jgi:hypothetical protein
MVNWGNVPSWIAAGTGFLTLCVALAAAGVAYNQLKLARALREDMARPYVVVDIEPAKGAGPSYMELVIRNIGKTMARNVNFTFDPPLRSTFDDIAKAAFNHTIAEYTILNDGIATMPPGREYRMVFEFMPDRLHREDLERRYDVTINFSSDRGEEKPLTQVLDLNLYFSTLHVPEHNIHHIAQTLRAWAMSAGVSSF